ncbi:unnamed protein product [Lathyrus sativus]|nr:unnamed protein product [Lathyrus sativus]
MSEVRIQAFDELYQSLRTIEGENAIYRFVKGRKRKTRDLDQVKCAKDEEENALVQEKDIKDRWKTYLNNLFNEGDIAPDSSRLNIREAYQNYNNYRQIQK